MEVAFPKVDPQVVPFASRILVQFKIPKYVTSGGIILVEDTRQTELWNTQIGKVLNIGPLAFKNRQTGMPWVEGEWCAIGDFVRVPKNGGDRWLVKVAAGKGLGPANDEVMVAIFDDLQLIGKITGDPLAIMAFD